MTKSYDNNAMECRVGLAVAASVEPMPVGLAGGSRDGIDTAQGGEGSLGVEAVRVTPCSNEEGRRRVWSYAEAVHQGWDCRPCESLDLGLQVLYLITELTVATGKGAKSILGRRGGTLQTTRPEALGPGDKGSSGEASEVLTKPGRIRASVSMSARGVGAASQGGRDMLHFDPGNRSVWRLSPRRGS